MESTTSYDFGYLQLTVDFVSSHVIRHCDLSRQNLIYLGPDQHAFESGAFEKANQLKSMLEEHQRETRRKREKGELPPHAPRWFNRRVDEDTGEGYWQWKTTPNNLVEYWVGK
jgi:hypothetical protein